jgi:hypothetical protein
VSEESSDPVEVTLDLEKYGWLSRIAWEPESFAEAMETGREGWIAFHQNDFQAAAKAFPKEENIGKSRAGWQLAIMYGDLNRYTGQVYERYYAAWSSRVELPKDSTAPIFASLAAHCTGSTRLRGWFSKVDDKMAGADLIEAIEMGSQPWVLTGSRPLVKRMAAHAEARKGNLSPLLDSATTPLFTEEATAEQKGGGDGATFERVYYDPCLASSFHAHWTLYAAKQLGGTEWTATVRGWTRPSALLRATLFAPWLDKVDLDGGLMIVDEAGEMGALNPSLRRMGVGIDPHHSDDVEAAREEVRSLDAGLDVWGEDLMTNAPDEGRALLTDLGILSHFRQEWLITRARLALLQGRPKQALAYLELGRDVTANEVGLQNNPQIYALLAETHLTLGHTREALDALEILSVAHPEVAALKEVTGDLAVLETLDSLGDSKEN